MSTAHPDSHSPHRMVKVQVLQTVDEVNARGPMSAAALKIFAAQNGRCELIEGNVIMMSPAGSEHGYVANEIAFLLTAQVRQHKLGRVVNVYPNTQTASIYRPENEVNRYQADDVIDLSDIVSGWKPALRTFFGSD